MDIRMKMRCAYNTCGLEHPKHNAMINLIQQMFGYSSRKDALVFAKMTNNDCEQVSQGGVIVRITAEQFAIFHILRKRDGLQQQIAWQAAEIVTDQPKEIDMRGNKPCPVGRAFGAAMKFGDLI